MSPEPCAGPPGEVVTMPLPVTPSGKGIERVDRSGQLAAEEFRLLVEGVKDYAIFLLDADGYVASWNPGAERIKGYTAPEILGEHFSRFYPEEDRAAGLPAKDLAEAANQDRSEGYRWRVRKDGSRFYARTTITALYDDNGNLHGFAKVTQDVTAEREAGRVLREREQQLAQAQAIARLGSFEWEIASDQVRWTAELRRICGLATEPTTTALNDFIASVHRDDRMPVLDAIRRAAGDGTPFRLEHRIVGPKGDIRVLVSWGRVMHDGRSSPSRVAVVFQDVTDQRQRDGRHEVLVRDRPTEEMFTTVCCLRISPDRHEILVASAGHPPPLLATDGTVQIVEAVGQPALGVLEQAHAWRTVRLRVADPWTMLCYTDGLIEGLQTPDSSERFGIEALSATATTLLAERVSMDALLDGLLDVVHQANGGDLSDDIAMLCVGTAPVSDGA